MYLHLSQKMLLTVALLLLSRDVVKSSHPPKFDNTGARSVLYATDSAWISEDQVPDEFEVLPIPNEEGLTEIIAPAGSDALLRGMGVNIVNVTVSRPFWEIEKEWRLQNGYRRQGPAGYNSPQELRQKINALVSAHPSLARLVNVMLEHGTSPTIEGCDIFALKISANVSVDEDEPNVLIVGAHHCRELVTPELILDQATRLLERYGSDSAITTLVNTHQFYLIWDQNPDGANHVWTQNNFWRKNRRQNSGGSFGVDLNRNYPVGWSFSCGGSTTQTSETYRGASAASEAETQAMLAFHADRHFAKVLDYHSYAREVRQIYGSCANLPNTLDSFFGQQANAIAQQMSVYRQARSCCTGGHVHAAFANQGALSYLVETATAFQPSAELMRQELVYVWPGTLHFLQIPITVSGHVRSNGQPVAVTFDIPELNYEVGEVVAYTTLPYARYHLWLPDGAFTFVLSYPGGSYTERVQVTQGMVRDFNI